VSSSKQLHLVIPVGAKVLTPTDGRVGKPNSKTVEGTLKRVECRGKTARIHIVSDKNPLAFDRVRHTRPETGGAEGRRQ